MGLQFPVSFGRQNISKPWHSSDTQVLVWPATAGLVLEAWPPLCSTGMGPSSAETVSTSSTASARRRGLLRLSPRPGTDGGDTAEPPLLAELLSLDRTLCLQTTPPNRREPLGDSTGAWSRGTLTLRLMLTTAMVALTLDTALAVMVDMDSDMAATAMVVLATVMARGPLTLRLMPTTALAVMVDMDLDMAATAMEVLATVMARGLLMPSLTMVVMVGPTLVLDTATEAMVELSVDTATW